MSSKATKKRSAVDLEAAETAQEETGASGLTVRQLFDLRTKALGLSGTAVADSDDEARSLLQQILDRSEELLLLDEEREEMEEEEAVAACAEAALDGETLDTCHVLFLKAFALHETAMSLHRTPATSAPASKRVKTDKAATLMDQAIEAYGETLTNGSPGSDLWSILVCGSFLKAKADEGTLALKDGDLAKLRDCIGFDLDGVLLGQGPSEFHGLLYAEDPFTDSFLAEIGDPATAWIDGISSFVALLRPPPPDAKLSKKTKEVLDSLTHERRKVLQFINTQMVEQVEQMDHFIKAVGGPEVPNSEVLRTMAYAWKLSLSITAAQARVGSYELDAVEARKSGSEASLDAAWTTFEPAAAALRLSVSAANEYIAALKEDGEADHEQETASWAAQLNKLITLYKDARDLFNTFEKVDKRKLEDELDKLRDAMAI